MNKWIANSPTRLLSFVREKSASQWSSKDLRWSIEHFRCSINGRVETFGSYRLRPGDRITFWPEKKPLFAIENGRILFEDEKLFVYNKPPYLDSPMLAQMLGHHLVHRLDRDTTGVILFAKDFATKKVLERQFRDREIRKEYIARVHGNPGKKGIVSGEMAVANRREGAVMWKMVPEGKGVWSKTEWEAIGSFIRCFPETGRTHQIRVHMLALGHPIVGDRIYGSRTTHLDVFRPMLHAYQLILNSGESFIAPLPCDFPSNPIYSREK